METKMLTRFDLYSEQDIAQFFVNNAIGVMCVQDNEQDDKLIDHIGQFYLVFGNFHMDMGFFDSPTEAFYHVITHPVQLAYTMALISNHLVNEAIQNNPQVLAPSSTSSQED